MQLVFYHLATQYKYFLPPPILSSLKKLLIKETIILSFLIFYNLIFNIFDILLHVHVQPALYAYEQDRVMGSAVSTLTVSAVDSDFQESIRNVSTYLYVSTFVRVLQNNLLIVVKVFDVV